MLHVALHLHLLLFGLRMHDDVSSIDGGRDSCVGTRVGFKVPREEGVPKVGFRSGRRIAVAEVAAGVNFRPAGGVQGQVAGSIPRRQQGTGTRRAREGAVTPSLHPEVPGVPIRVTWIRIGYQAIDKVCETARSGIWGAKGIVRDLYVPCQS